MYITDPLVASARAFAIAQHDAIQHRRRYTNEPYWHHLAEVAELVAAAGGTSAMIAAAWLHDVVEDTPVTHEQLAEHFPADVCELVAWLTDVSKLTDGNRATRKRIDREHTANAPAEAHTIKLADMISNSRSIIEHDPGFAQVYMAEKRLLMPVLADGNQDLYTQAQMIVYDYFNVV